MTILEALDICKRERKKVARRAWVASLPSDDLSRNYQLPSDNLSSDCTLPSNDLSSDCTMPSDDLSRNYSLPSYIFYSAVDESFVAGFNVPDAEDLELDTDPRLIDEDFRVGAAVTLWSTEDILADDWVIVGDVRSD